MREALFRDYYPVQSSFGAKNRGGGVLVAQSRGYDTNWAVEPRWRVFSFHKILVEARANMSNQLGPRCTCLLEGGGRRDEAPRGGDNKT